MPLFRILPYLYLFCWIVLAYLPYVFFAKVIYLSLLFYFTGTALYYTYYSIANYRLPAYFRFLFLFVFVLSIYGGYLLIVGDDVYWPALGQYVEKYNYLLWLITSLLSSVPVYVFTCRGLIGEREMKAFFLVCFISCIYAYYGSLKFQMKQSLALDPTQEDFTVTCVYSFLSLLPLIIMFRKKMTVQFALITASFVYCVLGAKRGPIILGGIASLLLILSMFRHCTIKRKVVLTLLVTLLFVGLYLFINYQLENNTYFVMRVEQTMDGYTSGRDNYAKNILNYFFDMTTTTQFFFGIGAQGTLSVNESYAHNDWLGIVLEQGIFGGCLYLAYWISFFYTWIKSKNNYEAFVVIGLLFIIGFGKSLFSMYYLPITAEMITSSGFFAVGLGFYLAKAYPQQNSFLLNVDVVDGEDCDE